MSLIVVVYGRYDLAYRTLASIAAGADVDYEVIVVDNASPDGAGRRLQGDVAGPRYLFNDNNVGFAAAVDLAALHARGPLVGLLNADIEVEPGFLSSCVAAFDTDPRAAAVCPLYLGATGLVLEAGGLVGADGRGWGYGVGRSPDHPGVGFRREVDYGSGAALVVHRDRFLQVGGLDVAYGLGYFEDADLCFALRDAGFVTLYEPRARVLHREHGSFGRASRQAQLARNRPLFSSRFRDQLAGRPLLHRPPYDPQAELVVRDWWAPQRLLVIDIDGGLNSLASEVQRRWPQARVTVVGRDGHDLDARIEHWRLERRSGFLGRWLARRRFHYSAVVTTIAGVDLVRQTLARTQPDAAWGLVGDVVAAPSGWRPLPPDITAAIGALGFPVPERGARCH